MMNKKPFVVSVSLTCKQAHTNIHKPPCRWLMLYSSTPHCYASVDDFLTELWLLKCLSVFFWLACSGSFCLCKCCEKSVWRSHGHHSCVSVRRLVKQVIGHTCVMEWKTAETVNRVRIYLTRCLKCHSKVKDQNPQVWSLCTLFQS